MGLQVGLPNILGLFVFTTTLLSTKKLKHVCDLLSPGIKNVSLTFGDGGLLHYLSHPKSYHQFPFCRFCPSYFWTQNKVFPPKKFGNNLVKRGQSKVIWEIISDTMCGELTWVWTKDRLPDFSILPLNFFSVYDVLKLNTHFSETFLNCIKELHQCQHLIQ